MKRKDIMIIIVPTLIFVILWVIFSIYHNFISSTIPETLNVQINPINPSFDLKTVNLLKNREKVNVIADTNIKISTSSPSVAPLQPAQVKTTSINQASASQGGSLTQ